MADEKAITLVVRMPLEDMRRLRFAAAHLETSLNRTALVLMREAMEARHIQIPTPESSSESGHG